MSSKLRIRSQILLNFNFHPFAPVLCQLASSSSTYLQVDQTPFSSLLRYIQKVKLLIFVSAGCFPSFDSIIFLFSSDPSLLFQIWQQDWVQYLYSPHVGVVYRTTPVSLLGLWSLSPLQLYGERSCLPNMTSHLCMAGRLILEVQPILFGLMCGSLYIKMLIIWDNFEVSMVSLHLSWSQYLFPP